MKRVTTTLVRVLVMTGVGTLLASTGCATTGEDSGAVSPARAAQLAEDDCSGVPTKERELGILAYREAVSAARPLKESEQVGKTKIFSTRGIVFAVRAEPGITARWLERVAACHIDLSTAGQLASNAGATDPLLVPGTTVRVEESATGYLVSVRVPNEDAASEVMRRAQAFLTGPTGPAMAQDVSP